MKRFIIPTRVIRWSRVEKLPDQKIQKFLKLGLFTLSGLYLILYLYLALQRIFFPFDIEWAEGAALLQVKQILLGKSLYQSPNLTFIPLVYTPLYHYLSAFASLLVGEGFTGLRLVSFLASIAAAGLIFWIVYRETEDGFAGWLSTTLYLACFPLSGGFYDLARVDSLFILLILVTILLYKRAEKGLGLAAAGTFVAISFFTKQTALVIFLPLLIYAGFQHRKESMFLYLTTLVGIVMPILIWNVRSSGWFQYYIFQLPQEHGYSIIDAVNFWVGDTLRPLGIAFTFGLVFLLQGYLQNQHRPQASETKGKAEGFFTFVVFIAGCFLGSWITRASNGGAENNNMPAYASLSLMLGLGFAQARHWILKQDKINRRGELIINLALMIQFIALLYNPLTYLPTPEDKRSNQDLIEFIEETPGDIFIPFRSHLPGFVDKSTHTHVVSIFELVGYFHGDVQPQGVALLDEIREKISNQEYGAVILDRPLPWFDEELEVWYQRLEGDDLPEEGVGSEVMDWQNGFRNIYVPIDQDQEE